MSPTFVYGTAIVCYGPILTFVDDIMTIITGITAVIETFKYHDTGKFVGSYYDI